MGICLKYRTNKAAEVGRLVSGLGRLAAGAKSTEFSSSGGLGTVSSETGPAGDVEMSDAQSRIAVSAGAGTGTGAVDSAQGTGTATANVGGGKGKKHKGGKGGKR
jgi:hypothetical protein